MSSEENKALVRRFLEEGLSRGDLHLAAALMAPDVVVHFGGLPEPTHGRAAWKQLAGAFFTTAFPGLRISVEDLLAEGDRVVARWSWRATHQGELMGVPATGKAVTATGCGIYRIAGGQIAEEWVQEDLLGLMQQLGVIPARGGGGA